MITKSPKMIKIKETDKDFKNAPVGYPHCTQKYRRPEKCPPSPPQNIIEWPILLVYKIFKVRKRICKSKCTIKTHHSNRGHFWCGLSSRIRQLPVNVIVNVQPQYNGHFCWRRKLASPATCYWYDLRSSFRV